MENLYRLLAATFTFGAVHGVLAADQYWVGGEGGLWVGDNWAEAADGTGAAWVDGSRGVFTTTPAAVDLAGFSPTATYLTGSGFSAGNLCEIVVTNASETVPTLTLTSAASDFTVASFSNVNVHCTTTGNMGLNNSSHLHLGEGAEFTMAGAGKVVKKGAGTLSVRFSPYNTGGMVIAEGTARLESGDQRIVNGPLSVKEGATLEIASGNTAPYHATKAGSISLRAARSGFRRRRASSARRRGATASRIRAIRESARGRFSGTRRTAASSVSPAPIST